MDHVGETFEDAQVWPRDLNARAMARSVAAEMHAGFGALRSACPMNLGKRYAPRDRGEAVGRDVARITAIWRDARSRFGAGGPFLFGAFSRRRRYVRAGGDALRYLFDPGRSGVAGVYGHDPVASRLPGMARGGAAGAVDDPER